MGLTANLLLGLTLLFGFAPQEEDTCEQLTELYGSASRDKRRSAVRRLAKLGTEEAWGLVVRALADSDGLVADEAEFRLAEAQAESTIELLYGRAGLKSKEAPVAISAASALGAINGEVDCEVLAKQLKARDDELRFALLTALEQRGRAGRLAGRRSRILRGVLSAKRTARMPWTQACALVTAAVVAETEREREDLAREVTRAAKDREPSMRIAALLASESSAWLSPLASDSAVCVRLQVVASAKLIADREAARVLVGMLESETHPRVRWQIVGALQQISGLLHRGDPRPWRDWLARLSKDWRGTDKSPKARNRAASRASLAGLPILSDRIVFLIDFSGSLWTKRRDGTIRKAYADAELRKALESLPETAHFNLIPYTSVPHPWKPELVRATKRNVGAAIQWFEECTESGTGDFYEAAQLALLDPEVDTILTFTDGLPTGGRRCRLDLMVPSLLKRARFRRIAFDTLLVDAPKRLHRHWQRLADESGGQLHAVSQ